MDIKGLPQDVKSYLRNGTNINSVAQCVTELVLNSLDAKSTAIAVRVNLQTFRIQVVDNGDGITKSNMNLTGIRYMTSKCHSLTDLKKLKRFGFRGEALATIRGLSIKVIITSRPRDIENTYSKTCQYKKWGAVQLVKYRPSQGTTVTVEGFMHNMPVRQKRVSENLDLNEIKRGLENLAIIHPSVSFNLRNDTSGKIIMQSKQTQTVSQALINFYPDLSLDDLVAIRACNKDISVSGLICKKPYPSKLQLIYLNKRPINVPEIHKAVNLLLLKLQDKSEHVLYVLNIRCPYSKVDLNLSPSKKAVGFKEFDKVLKCVEKAVTQFLGKENLIDCASPAQAIQNDVQSFQSKFGVSQIQGAVKSVAFKRKPEADVALVKKLKINFDDKLENLNSKKSDEDCVQVQEISSDSKPKPDEDNQTENWLDNVLPLTKRKKRKYSKKVYAKTPGIKMNNNSVPNIDVIENNDAANNKRETEIVNCDVNNKNIANIFEKHANTQSLVLNSECGPSQPINPLLNSSINTDILHNQKNGKDLIMEMFLKSTVVYPPEETETNKSVITEATKFKQNTTMTMSFKVMSKRTIMTNTMRISRNVNHENDNRKEKQFKHRTLEVDHTKSVVSKCIQTTMIDQNKVNFNHDKSEFSFIPQNVTLSKYFGNSHEPSFIYSYYDLDQDTHKPDFTWPEKGPDFINNWTIQSPNSVLNTEDLNYNFHNRNFRKPIHKYCSKYDFDFSNFDESNRQFLRHKQPNNYYPMHFQSNDVTNTIPIYQRYNPHRERYYNYNHRFDDFQNPSQVFVNSNRNFLNSSWNFRNSNQNFLNPSRNFLNSNQENHYDTIDHIERVLNTKLDRNLDRNCNFAFNKHPKKKHHNNQIKKFNLGQCIHNNHKSEHENYLQNNNRKPWCSKGKWGFEENKYYSPFFQPSKKYREKNKHNQKQTNNLRNRYQNLFTEEYRVSPFFDKQRKDLTTINKRQLFSGITECQQPRAKDSFAVHKRQHQQKRSAPFLEQNWLNRQNVAPKQNQNNFLQGVFRPEKTNLFTVQDKNAHQPFKQFHSNPLQPEFPQTNKLRQIKSFPFFKKPHPVNNRQFPFKKTGNTPQWPSTNNKESEFDFTTPNINKSTNTTEKINLCLTKNSTTTSVHSGNFKPVFSSTQFEIVEESPSQVLQNDSKIDCNSGSVIDASTNCDNCTNVNPNLNFQTQEDKNKSYEQNRSVLNISINSIKKAILIEAGLADDCRLNKTENESDQLDIHCSEHSSNCENDTPVNEWVKTTNRFGSTFYVNKRTGMTSFYTPKQAKQDNQFTLTKRFEFVPKGLSPILVKTEPVTVSLSPTSKKTLNTAILASYENELDTIKWSNYIQNYEDVNKFFKELYKEKTKHCNYFIQNATTSELPRSIVKLYKNLQMQSFTKDIFTNLKIIGQLDNKFIVSLLKDKQLIVLFDQHAVHERVRLENLLDDYKISDSPNRVKFKSTKCDQRIIVNLSEADRNIVENFKKAFEDVGLLFENVQSGIEVTHIPTCIYNKFFTKHNQSDESLKNVITALIYEHTNMIVSTRGVTSKIPMVLQDVINSEACRGAIKFGNKLIHDECVKHIESLSECNLPFQCAHGRPTLMPIVNLERNLEFKTVKPNLQKLKLYKY